MRPFLGVLPLLLVACHPHGVAPPDTSPPDTPETTDDSDPPEETDAPDDSDPPDDTDAPADRSPFTIVLLPDTQEYTDSYPQYFIAQTGWLAEQGSDITFALHLGDVTDDNSDEQWTIAEQALSALDGTVPYLLNLGNHDMGTDGNAGDRFTRVDDYFPPARFAGEAWYGGNQQGSNADYWVQFEAAGMDFLVLSLEFGPTDETLAWASGVIEDHPEHRIILVTHCYMLDDDTLVNHSSGFSPHNYGIDAADVNDGAEIWEEFASQHERLFLVVCGHVTGDGSGKLSSQGVHGNTVHQLMANHQHEPSGGRGWLRLLTFHPDEDRIAATAYSPVVAVEEGEDEAWRLDDEYSYDLDYDMGVD